MKNTVVIFQSKYGSTKKYAEWIAEELDCDLVEGKKATLELLEKYETIIYGGGLYASGINGISFITNHFNKIKEKNVVIFTVGLANPNIKEQFKPIIDKNFTMEMQGKFKIFHLRGGIDYKRLSFTHKGMMALLVKIVRKKSDEELTDEDRMMLSTYGDIVDFSDRATIAPLVAYVKTL